MRGRVQGVNFRWYATEEARRLGVTGWIRNRDDGDVDVLVEAETDGLNAFAEWCSRGPRHARVDAVEREDRGEGRRYRDFAIVEEPPE